MLVRGGAVVQLGGRPGGMKEGRTAVLPGKVDLEAARGVTAHAPSHSPLPTPRPHPPTPAWYERMRKPVDVPPLVADWRSLLTSRGAGLEESPGYMVVRFRMPRERAVGAGRR